MEAIVRPSVNSNARHHSRCRDVQSSCDDRLRCRRLAPGVGAMLRLTVLLPLLLSLTVFVPAISAASRLRAQGFVGATLTVLRGQVEVVKSDGSVLSPAPSGTTLEVGDAITTAPDSGGLITFFEGSEIEIGGNAGLVIKDIASQGTRTSITVLSLIGATVHNVVTFSDPASSYRVESAGTVAVVRGTAFGHSTSDTGEITIAVAQGAVNFPRQDEPPLMPGEKRTHNPASGATVTSTFVLRAPDGQSVDTMNLSSVLRQLVSTPAQPGGVPEVIEIAPVSTGVSAAAPQDSGPPPPGPPSDISGPPTGSAASGGSPSSSSDVGKPTASSPPSKPALNFTIKGNFDLKQSDGSTCADYSVSPETKGTIELTIRIPSGADKGEVTGRLQAPSQSGQRHVICGQDSVHLTWRQEYSATISGTAERDGDITAHGTINGRERVEFTSCQVAQARTCPPYENSYSFPVSVDGDIEMDRSNRPGKGDVKVGQISKKTEGSWRASQ